MTRFGTLALMLSLSLAIGCNRAPTDDFADEGVEANATAAESSKELVSACNDAMTMAVSGGLITEQPEGARMVVDEEIWNMFPAEAKASLIRCAAEVQGAGALAPGQKVAVYSAKTGKQIK